MDVNTQKKIHIWTEGIALQIKIFKIRRIGLCVNDKTMLKDLPEKVDLEPMFCVPKHIQFLAMTNLLISSETDIACIVKCLKLYGSNMMDDNEAIDWLSEFDKHLADKFKEIILENDAASFLPLNLKLIINKEISPQLQLWAFGSKLLKELNKLISKQQMKTIDNKNKPKVTSKTYHIINFLNNRIDLFYQELLKIQKSISNFKKPEYSAEVIEALYGKQIKNLSGDSISTQRIMSHCYNFGRETIESLVHYITDLMNSYSPSNIEWRNHYEELLRPQFVKKMIVFQGYQDETPNNPNLIKDMLKLFLSKFNKISVNFIDNFMKIFEQKTIYLKESGVLCLYYFLTILKSVHSYNDFNDHDLERIPNLIFEEDIVPFKEYDDSLLANIDIPMKFFAKFAYKSEKEGLFYENSSSLLFNYDSPFFFELTFLNNDIVIDSSMNICVRIHEMQPSNEDPQEAK